MTLCSSYELYKPVKRHLVDCQKEEEKKKGTGFGYYVYANF